MCKQRCKLNRNLLIPTGWRLTSWLFTNREELNLGLPNTRFEPWASGLLGHVASFRQSLQLYILLQLYSDPLCFHIQENVAIVEFGAKTQILHNLSTNYLSLKMKIGKLLTLSCTLWKRWLEKVFHSSRLESGLAIWETD